MNTNPRTFPGPWQVEVGDGAFIVRDAKGFPVTYVYWKPQQAMRDQYFTQTEALVIAERIFKLPELLSGKGQL
jgi:hypothetical protein